MCNIIQMIIMEMVTLLDLNLYCSRANWKKAIVPFSTIGVCAGLAMG